MKRGGLLAAVALVGPVVVVLAAIGGLYYWTIFGDHEESPPSCDGGFQRAEWKRDSKATGRAIANCDWLDGKPIAAVVRMLGAPDAPTYRGWHTWEIGVAESGIGPASWFLTLRVEEGVVVRSHAEVRAT